MTPWAPSSEQIALPLCNVYVCVCGYSAEGKHIEIYELFMVYGGDFNVNLTRKITYLYVVMFFFSLFSLFNPHKMCNLFVIYCRLGKWAFSCVLLFLPSFLLFVIKRALTFLEEEFFEGSIEKIYIERKFHFRNLVPTVRFNNFLTSNSHKPFS
jgi:hypothetical protein